MSRAVGRAEDAHRMIRKMIVAKRAQANKLLDEANELETIAPADDPRQIKMPETTGKK